MEQPLISVIVPVYKVDAYLDKCISSIVEQTYRNLEIILVDDGSPDASGAICDAWAEKDSRIQVIHQQNAGGGAARNAGLDTAKGSFIGFVDSDDYIAPTMYQELGALLEKGAQIAECGYLETETDDTALGGGENTPQWYSREQAMEAHVRDTMFQQRIWNKLYRREVVGKVRFPVGTRIDDEFFTYRLLGNAKKLVRTDRQLYAYRQQPGSIMHTKAPAKKLEGLEAKKQRLEYLKEGMPQLAGLAKTELLLSCIYALQDWQRQSAGPERMAAEEEICGRMRALGPQALDCAEGAKQKLLLRLALCWPRGVGKLLNLLIDIGILK